MMPSSYSALHYLPSLCCHCGTCFVRVCVCVCAHCVVWYHCVHGVCVSEACVCVHMCTCVHNPGSCDPEAVLPSLILPQPMEVYVDDDTKLTLHGLQQHYIKLQDREKNRKLFDLLDALEFNQVPKTLWSFPQSSESFRNMLLLASGV